MARVQVKAKAFGTINGPSGDIIHTDPTGSDPRARKPIVDIRDVPLLVQRGLIEEPKGALRPISRAVELEASTAVDRAMSAARFSGAGTFSVAMVDEVSAEAIEQTAEIDSDAGPIPSGLGHRDAIHYPLDQNVRGAIGGDLGGAGLFADDVDAPPGGDENRTAAGSSKRDGAAAGTGGTGTGGSGEAGGTGGSGTGGEG